MIEVPESKFTSYLIYFYSMINVVDESGNSNSPYSPVAERKFTHFVPRSKFLQNEYSDLPRARQRGLGSMDYDKVFQDPSSFKRSMASG